MPVSSTLWDKIETRIDTKPDKPKYWMLFLLVAVAAPALFVSLSERPVLPESKPYVDNIITNPEINNKKVINHSTQIANHTLQEQAVSFQKEDKIINTKNNNTVQILSDNVRTREASYSEKLNIEFSDNTLNSENIYDEPLESVLLKFGYIDKLPNLTQSNRVLLSKNDNGDERPFIQRLFSAGTQCPKFSHKLKGLYAWTNYTSAYVDQSLSADSGELGEYISKRENSENSLYSFSTSLGLGYIHASGWFVESGLTYDQINTRFHQIEEDIIGTEEIIRTSKDEDGNITGTFTEIIPIIGFNEIRHTNKITQIEVPLLIGYELPVSPGLSLNLKAGPNFNLSSNSAGRILDIEGNPIFFGDNTNVNLYRDKFGVGYIAGAHLVKNLSNKLSFDIGMTYKSYGDTQDSSNPIIQSFSKYGLSSGLRYRFL